MVAAPLGLVAAEGLLASAIAAGASRHVAAATAVALWRSLVLGDADLQGPSPCEAVDPDVAEEVEAREAFGRDALVEKVSAGRAGRAAVLTGTQRARRNVMQHWRMGCGAEAVSQAAARPQAAQRGPRGPRGPNAAGKARAARAGGVLAGDGGSEASSASTSAGASAAATWPGSTVGEVRQKVQTREPVQAEPNAEDVDAWGTALLRPELPAVPGTDAAPAAAGATGGARPEVQKWLPDMAEQVWHVIVDKNAWGPLPKVRVQSVLGEGAVPYTAEFLQGELDLPITVESTIGEFFWMAWERLQHDPYLQAAPGPAVGTSVDQQHFEPGDLGAQGPLHGDRTSTDPGTAARPATAVTTKGAARMGTSSTKDPDHVGSLVKVQAVGQRLIEPSSQADAASMLPHAADRDQRRPGWQLDERGDLSPGEVSVRAYSYAPSMFPRLPKQRRTRR